MKKLFYLLIYTVMVLGFYAAYQDLTTPVPTIECPKDSK